VSRWRKAALAAAAAAVPVLNPLRSSFFLLPCLDELPGDFI
jgi:hypothetical protein